MSLESGSQSAAGPNLNLTPEEKRLYGDLFRQADPENLRVVTGDAAISFFEKTRLDSRVLGEIWQIADKENRGFLTPQGFGIVLRLIGHAQAGREPRPDLALQPGPLPRFDGIQPPIPSSSTPPPGSFGLQMQPTGNASRIPPLPSERVVQYSTLFEKQPLQGNLLSGEQARQIFDKSGLPTEVLGRVWALADTEQRGSLTQPEFAVAMHLLTCLKTGTIRALPNTLPTGLLEAATPRASISATRHSPISTGASAIPRQLSGTAQPRTASPLGRPPLMPQATGTQAGDWAITPADKARFDQIYATLDASKKGYITGDEAVPFFSQSNLSEDVLAQIWDLADFNSQGYLNPDGFAVAMYLIRQQRSGRSPPLPNSLPPNLVPPSFRVSGRQGSESSSPFDPPSMPQPPAPQPKSALDDLFGLDPLTASPTTTGPTQTASPTGPSHANDPFGEPSAPVAPASHIGGSSSASSFKPFVPSSSFGRGLSSQLTEDANASSPQRAHSEDLLDDDDPEASKKISGETTKLANLSNQIGILSKQMQNVQSKRTSTQNDLSQTNSQKQNFEHRLAQLRVLYEKEAEGTKALEEQLKKSRADSQQLQRECMSLEGQLRDTQMQHRQLLEALMSDQRENSALRERIRVVNGEIAQLKPRLEKLKSDARQQKGLVAINKKQLATTEAERGKLTAEAEGLSRDPGGSDPRRTASSSPASIAQLVASPTPSTSSANNPFFKRTTHSDAAASPAPRGVSDKSFDEVFGPTSVDPTPHSQSSTTSVKQQHTGNSSTSVNSFTTPLSTPTISRQGNMAVEPPAPPPSGQISSNLLPFPGHSESVSSSRQVSPPASRAEGSIDGLARFPPEEAPAVGGLEIPSSIAVSSKSSKDEVETPVSTPLAENAPGIDAADNVTAQDVQGDRLPPQHFESTGRMDDAKGKADFDNMFAAFAASSNSQGKNQIGTTNSQSAFDTEFPPISELERGGESDSSEAGGFDDDFTPASPEARKQPGESHVSQYSNGILADKESSEPPESLLSSTGGAKSQVSVAESTAASATESKIISHHADDVFSSTTSATAPPPPPKAKTSTAGDLDDFDDFEGLEDAKEGSADDDFATISRDDFNPVFDMSPPVSQGKSEPTAMENTKTSFDLVPPNPQPVVPPVRANTVSKDIESRDWDAIFAGLDSPSAIPSTGIKAYDQTNEKGQQTRPTPPGRALTDHGEHDDPIVKNLTSMGYSRADAVTALEKYDYNLERAANFLASQS